MGDSIHAKFGFRSAESEWPEWVETGRCHMQLQPALWHINEVHFEIETGVSLENVSMQSQVTTSLLDGE